MLTLPAFVHASNFSFSFIFLEIELGLRKSSWGFVEGHEDAEIIISTIRSNRGFPSLKISRNGNEITNNTAPGRLLLLLTKKGLFRSIYVCVYLDM